MRLARHTTLRTTLVMASLPLAMTWFGCDQKTTGTASPDTPVATTSSQPEVPTEAREAPTAEPVAPVASNAEAETAKDPAAPKDTSKPTPGKPTPATTKGGEEPAAEPKKGADVSAASFATWLQSSGTYEAGKLGNVTAVLVAKSPYKCNAKYPYKFKLDAPSGGVTYPQDTVRDMQISPKRSTMAVPFVPAQAGQATISGTLSFSICTDERCVIEKRPLSVTVDVK